MGQLERLLNKQNDVILLSKPNNDAFESTYIDVRKKEKRILTDDQVSLLPNADINDPHCREWKIRKNSADKLVSYIQYVSPGVSDWILDIGSGNGWFSNLLAKAVKAKILGIDINLQELRQAARVFKRENLHFAYWNMFQENIEPGQFSMIILNSSFQYFNEPEILFEQCLTLLKDGGEIHIIDSPIYKEKEIGDAKLRTKEYYQKIQAEEMIEYYHHHNHNLFRKYNTEILYKPTHYRTLKGENDSPFPWLKINK